MLCGSCGLDWFLSWMGMTPGAEKIDQVRGSDPMPELILRWRDDWTMEDVIGWILKGNEGAALVELQVRIDREFESIDDLVGLFKVNTGRGRLKTDYLAYEEVAWAIGRIPGCRSRAEVLLKAVTLGTLGRVEGCDLVRKDDEHSTVDSAVLRLEP